MILPFLILNTLILARQGWPFFLTVARWLSHPGYFCSTCVCRGALRTLSKRLSHGAASSSQRASTLLGRSGGQARDDIRCQHEASLASAQVLEDSAGYRRALRMYCQHLAETADEGRLREV